MPRQTKSVILTEENYDAIGGEFKLTPCCAFTQYEGLDLIDSVEDAVAIRRAAGDEIHDDMNCSIDIDDYAPNVIVTVAPNQTRRMNPLLKGAGFKKVYSGPRSGGTGGNTDLWIATSLKMGGVTEPKSPVEETVKFQIGA